VSHLERKNELLLTLKETIAGLPPDERNDEGPRQIMRLIDENIEVDNDFDRFSKNFEMVYPDFFKQLRESATENLSHLDMRYCAYMYMGLSTKEMSNLLNIDPASIRTARYRIKQKFNLSKDDDLVAFVNTCLAK
jgi:DNA-binding CsgD family transcriptional regulator